jgi:non-heme chloroperoxidase
MNCWTTRLTVTLALLCGWGGELHAQLPAGASAPVPAWRDTSPHQVRQVRVSPEVALEVVDWGGSGPPLVFLAGSGNSAHVFDGFASRFTSRFRVVGITRRGTGAPARPTAGYDSGTLTRDVAAVLDSIGIGRATFVAHSFGGSELHYLATRMPGRVERLVYLDAAYDYHALFASAESRSGQLRTPEPPVPAYDDNTAPFWTLFAERVSGPGYPESEVRTIHSFDAASKYLRPANIDSLQLRLDRGVTPVDFRQFRAPTLAIYAVPGAVETMFPYWATLDATAQGRARTSYAAVRALLDRLQAQFQRDVPQARVIVIPGARHYVFLTHPGEVEHAMLEFLVPPPPPGR